MIYIHSCLIIFPVTKYTGVFLTCVCIRRERGREREGWSWGCMKTMEVVKKNRRGRRPCLWCGHELPSDAVWSLWLPWRANLPPNNNTFNIFSHFLLLVFSHADSFGFVRSENFAYLAARFLPRPQKMELCVWSSQCWRMIIKHNKQRAFS